MARYNRRKKVIRKKSNRGPLRNSKRTTNLNPVQGRKMGSTVGGGLGGSRNEGPSHMCVAWSGFETTWLDHGFCWNDNHCYWQCIGSIPNNNNHCPWGPQWPCCNVTVTLESSNCGGVGSCTCYYQQNGTEMIYQYGDLPTGSVWKGDVNFDGIVNVQDVLQTVNYILGTGNYSQLQQYIADINNDGTVNIQDVHYTVNCIMDCAHSSSYTGNNTCISNCLGG